MDFKRANTPPFLKWICVSLTCTPEHSDDEDYPFKTIKDSYSELPLDEDFRFPRRIDPEEEKKRESPEENTIEMYCKNLKEHQAEIIKECESDQDYYGIFACLSTQIEQIEREF